MAGCVDEGPFRVAFTAGDLRHICPDSVPDWVANGEWETIGVKGVIPGVGFVPEPKGDWHPFGSFADEAAIWI